MSEILLPAGVDIEAVGVDATGGVHPLEKIETLLVAGHGESRQQGSGPAAPDDIIPPPLSLEQLSALSTINGVRGSCIEAISRNTVGLGYAFNAPDGQSADNLAERGREITDQLNALAKRDTRMYSPTFSEQLVAVKADEEECGWGFLEVSRNQTSGMIDGTYRVPAKRMRRLKDRTGFRLLPPDYGTTSMDSSGPNEVNFYNFGEKVKYDGEGNGATPTGELEDGKDWATNEVICFRLHTSESRDYGLPRDHSLAIEYAADKLAADNSVGFFDASGTPPTIIFVQGEERRDAAAGRVTFRVPQETVTKIGETLKAGQNRQHRVAIIPVPPGTKTDKHDLGKISERDMGFVEFRKSTARRILSKFRLSPIFVSDVDDGGRYTAEVQRALTLEQVFDPEQTRYEGRVQETVLRDLGITDVRIKFKRLAVEGDSAKRQAGLALAQEGSCTNRELRAAHGYGPLPESDKDDPVEAAKEGKVEKGWNDKLVTPSTSPLNEARPQEIPPAAHVPPGTPGPGGPQQPPGAQPDQRGLRPGIGGRQAQTPAGAQAAAVLKVLLKGEGSHVVEPSVDELAAALTDLSDEAIDRALARTHALGDVLADRLAAASGNGSSAE